MKTLKYLMLPAFTAALFLGTAHTAARRFPSASETACLPIWILRDLPTTALRTVIMARNGSQAAYSSARGRGFMGQRISMGTSTTIRLRKGYQGPFPARGEKPAPNRAAFKGTAMHDPHGKEERPPQGVK